MSYSNKYGFGFWLFSNFKINMISVQSLRLSATYGSILKNWENSYHWSWTHG